MSEIKLERDGKDDWSKEVREAFAEFQARALLANISVVCVVTIDMSRENALSIHFGKASSGHVSVEMCQDIASMFESTANRLKQ